jgi:hypothetical protein
MDDIAGVAPLLDPAYVFLLVAATWQVLVLLIDAQQLVFAALPGTEVDTILLTS